MPSLYPVEPGQPTLKDREAGPQLTRRKFGADQSPFALRYLSRILSPDQLQYSSVSKWGKLQQRKEVAFSVEATRVGQLQRVVYV